MVVLVFAIVREHVRNSINIVQYQFQALLGANQIAAVSNVGIKCTEINWEMSTIPLIKCQQQQCKTIYRNPIINYVSCVPQVRGRFTMEAGIAGEVIVDMARRESAELVVIGTRGWGKIRRTILGSVSDYVIHHAHCGVLTIRKSTPL